MFSWPDGNKGKCRIVMIDNGSKTTFPQVNHITPGGVSNYLDKQMMISSIEQISRSSRTFDYQLSEVESCQIAGRHHHKYRTRWPLRDACATNAWSYSAMQNPWH